jgi:hypothetical protein
MITTVLVFAAITALVEFILLYWRSLDFLTWSWGPLSTAGVVHTAAFAVNLIIHWGTIVGSMTAATALLVSFAVFPLIIWIKTYNKEYADDKV